ncbi:unnamed protein product [Rotaria socialis]|uniref:Uncharacterized protein n=1 Tax=Rotaria socialis TaxID=392032 RepID=A0A817ZMZ9_9BILA|nr:unnamed protein product [Rotaria socialis]
MMKIFSVLLFLIIFIKYTESKSLRRSYLVVKSSDEKKLLYRIQTSTSDIDTIILVDNPIVANTEDINLVHNHDENSFFILSIKRIELTTTTTTKAIRSFLVVKINTNSTSLIHEMTIFYADERKLLYRLKASTSDIDTIVLVNYPARNIVAYVEGI